MEDFCYVTDNTYTKEEVNFHFLLTVIKLPYFALVALNDICQFPLMLVVSNYVGCRDGS